MVAPGYAYAISIIVIRMVECLAVWSFTALLINCSMSGKGTSGGVVWWPWLWVMLSTQSCCQKPTQGYIGSTTTPPWGSSSLLDIGVWGLLLVVWWMVEEGPVCWCSSVVIGIAEFMEGRVCMVCTVCRAVVSHKASNRIQVLSKSIPRKWAGCI